MYTKQDLKTILTQNVANITFRKVNNEERRMVCTLKPDLLPIKENKQTTRTKPENEDVLAVWDLEQQAFRSFRINSLIEYSII